MKMAVLEASRCVVSFACVVFCVSLLPTPTFTFSQEFPQLNCTSNSTTVLSMAAKNYPGYLIFGPIPSQLGNITSTTCAMNITTTSDKILAFQFILSGWSTLNKPCVPGQYLEIFDGSSSSSRSIYKECNRSSNGATFYTSGPRGYVELNLGLNPDQTYVFIRILAVKPETCSGMTNLPALPSMKQNITSPYNEYGLSYPLNISCSWRITAPKNYVIVINAVSDVNCAGNDSLEIYDSNSSVAAHKLSSICFLSSLSDKYFYSTGQDVFISFRSDGNLQHRSLRKQYFILYYQAFKQECRDGAMKTLNASFSLTGQITSPRPPQGLSYPPNCNCSWRIKAPPDHVIKIEVEANVLCTMNDYLKVYDSDSNVEEDLLDNICSLARKQTIYSTGEDMYVSFTSDMTSQSVALTKRFSIRYIAFKPGTSCSTGNTADQNKNIIIRGTNQGIIQSPNFPKPFPKYLNCFWKFRAPSGHVVNLYFETVDLKTGSCLTPLSPELKVKDGYKDVSTVIDVVHCYAIDHYTYYKPSFTSVSSGKRLVVQFVTGSAYIKGHGFKANFTMEPIVSRGTCGEGRDGVIHVTGQGSSIKSPGYTYLPNTKHPKNMKCVWNITVDEGFVIKVKVVDNELSLGCNSGEYAHFIDGTTLNSTKMFTLCNKNEPDTRYSTGNNILIEFNTISSDNRGSGFFVSYMAVRKAAFPYSCTSNSLITSLTNSTSQLASFGYPSSYPNNAFCIWKYQVTFGNRARLTITKLELQNSTGCKADYVRVTGSDYFASPVLGQFCGKPKTPIAVTSSGNSIMVSFRSDWMGRFPGFEGIFEPIRDDSLGSCRIQGRDNFIPLNSTSGVFSSPRYPNYLPKTMSCIWQITVPKGSHIRLIIKNFDLDYKCEYSSLEIRDGSPQEPTSKVIGRYCSRNKVPSIFSTGNFLWVHLKSTDKTLLSRGFNAMYSTVSTLPLSVSCRNPRRQTIKSSSGQIASYDYPLKYDNNVSCEWSITVDSSKRVKLTFDTFSLEESSGCIGDHVAFYDGYYGELLGKYCGGSKPDPVYSSGSTLYIKFATDGKGRYQGFKASFESVLSVRTIILIVTFTLVGVGVMCSLIGWCIKGRCLGTCTSGSQPAPADGTSVAGSNFQLTTTKM